LEKHPAIFRAFSTELGFSCLRASLDEYQRFERSLHKLFADDAFLGVGQGLELCLLRWTQIFPGLTLAQLGELEIELRGVVTHSRSLILCCVVLPF
jgi:ribosomal protein RSM22 (predicted rRNA methylase)